MMHRDNSTARIFFKIAFRYAQAQPAQSCSAYFKEASASRERTWSIAPQASLELKFRPLERAPIVNPFVLKKNNM